MNQDKLEMNLLEYWEENDIERVYKFKESIYEYDAENDSPIALFSDESDQLFKDLPRIYKYGPALAYSDAVPIAELIAARGGKRIAYILTREKQVGDPEEWPDHIYMRADAKYMPTSGDFVPLFSQYKSQALRLYTEKEAYAMLRKSYATEIERIYGEDEVAR